MSIVFQARSLGIAVLMFLICSTAVLAQSVSISNDSVAANDAQTTESSDASETDDKASSYFDNEDEEEADSDFPSILSIFEGLEAGETNDSDKPVKRKIPVVFEETVKTGEDASDIEFQPLKFSVGYDKGFAFLPYDKKTPFSLRINGWIQFRHHGFARDSETWTDNAGVTRRIRNRNTFDIERARLYFKGSALHERLTYFYHLDGDTDGRHAVDFFDYWWGWKFSDRFRIQVGKRKVTAGRQWLLGARRTRFVDRPMANDFFRPDRTIGIFGLGNVGETMNYEWMIGNGYRTANLPNALTDDQLTYAFTQYFDPFGDYGSQLVDYDWNCDPLVRFGHSFVYSPITSEVLGSPFGESDFIRLSDGTRLGQIGALAPGVTVSGVNVLYYGVDLAVKSRGWSVNSEIFLRWLEDFEADGALPVDELMQRGFYVEGGRFLIPQKLDVNLRYSQVRGLLGGGSEYAAGFNWYPIDTHKMKISFDVTELDGSPLNNTTSDILVGDDGTLFRTQFQAEF